MPPRKVPNQDTALGLMPQGPRVGADWPVKPPPEGCPGHDAQVVHTTPSGVAIRRCVRCGAHPDDLEDRP